MFAFFGSDEGQSNAAAMDCFARISAGSDGWGDETIDGTAATVDEGLSRINQCLNALQTVNMFGGAKTIWLKGASFFADSPQGMRSDAIVQALDRLLEVIQNMPPDTNFIISALELDKRRAFYKKLGKFAKVQEFNKIDISKTGWERELSTFIMQLAKPLDLRFDAAALDLFVHRVHENSRQIQSELQKLRTYLGADSRALTVRDIELMVAVSRDGVVFEISRALEQGRASSAIKLIDAQLERGEAAVMILRTAILPTVRNRYLARLMMDRFKLPAGSYGSFDSALAGLPPHAQRALPLKKDGTPNAYGIFNTVKSLGKLTLAKARQALIACAEADRALVSTGLDARHLLHRLVVRITS